MVAQVKAPRQMSVRFIRGPNDACCSHPPPSFTTGDNMSPSEQKIHPETLIKAGTQGTKCTTDSNHVNERHWDLDAILAQPLDIKHFLEMKYSDVFTD